MNKFYSQPTQIYDRIEDAEVTREARTAEQMAAEATELRALFEPHERFSDSDE